MKQRAILIALVLACLMTVVSLVELWGWEESEREPTTAVEAAAGCFDIITQAEHTVDGRSHGWGRGGGSGGSGDLDVNTQTFALLLDKCSGATWLLGYQKQQPTGRAWFPLHKY